MKISLPVLMLVLMLSNCTITKRKYMSGWHFEKIHKKNNATVNADAPVGDGKKNIPINPATTKLTTTTPSGSGDPVKQTKLKNPTIKKVTLLNRTMALTTEKEVPENRSLLNQLAKYNAAQKGDKASKNGTHILLTYSVFFLGLAAFALVIPSLMLAQGIAGLMLAAGLILLALSIAMSASFLQDLREEKSSDVKWPYKLIIGFGALLLSLLITGILIVMLYLIIFDPPLVTIVLSASLCFLVCMIIMLKPLLSETN